MKVAPNRSSMAPSSSAVLYPTDLSDPEWRLVEPLLPCPSHTGRPRRWNLRLMPNIIFYQLKSGLSAITTKYWCLLNVFGDFSSLMSVISLFRLVAGNYCMVIELAEQR